MLLPTELHRQILPHLDHRSLLMITSANRYFRALLITVPVVAIQASINDYIQSFVGRNHTWTEQDTWEVVHDFESANQDFLEKTEMIPC